MHHLRFHRLSWCETYGHVAPAFNPILYWAN